MSHLSAVAELKAADSLVETTKKRRFSLFDHTCAYCRQKNHFVVKYSAKGKVSTVQAMQALETEVVRW